jgi:hypothetical protein
MPEESHPPKKKRTPFLPSIGVEWRIMAGIGLFFGVTVLIYAFTSVARNVDPSTGVVLLIFTVILGVLPGSYLASWSWRMRHQRPRPEDREDATYAESAGPVGSFPDESIWPVVLGLGAALTVVGIVFPLWLAAVGISLAFGALLGVVVESRRGGTV